MVIQGAFNIGEPRQMNELIDLVGQRFGRLTVIERAENNNGTAQWLCKCDCGNTKIVRGTYLRNGNTRSCGCLQQENRQRSKLKDLTGQKFGKLTVIERAENDNKGNVQWLCQCECGNKKVVRGSSLKSGNSHSCGCLIIENVKTRMSTHKMAKTRLYKIWAGMKQRCINPNTTGFENYGGRGIDYIPEWENFETFKEWAIQSGYNDALTIDRIDVNKGYSPQNCRWANETQQARNKRSNLYFTYQNQTRCLKDWATYLKIDYLLLYGRIVTRHWDFEKAINTPIMENRRNKRETNR